MFSIYFEDFFELLSLLIRCAIYSIHQAGQLPVEWEDFLKHEALHLISWEGDSLIFPNIKPQWPSSTPSMTCVERKDDLKRKKHNIKVTKEWNEKIKKIAVAAAIISFQPTGLRYAGWHYRSYFDKDCLAIPCFNSARWASKKDSNSAAFQVVSALEC